jgi:hypothetical protein
MKTTLFILYFSFLFPDAYEGVTLISGRGNLETFLINNNNDTLNIWESIPSANSICYLNTDSTLVCPHLPIDAINQDDGGRFTKYSWGSEVLWDYELPDSICQPHHDIAVLPNENILSICTEFKNIDEVQNMGYVSEVDSLFGFDMIVEIEPVGFDSANIVWQWKSSEHLIQDINPNFENYGNVSEHPELLNINMLTDGSNTKDWLHSNCISYNSLLDQIVLSARFSSEFYVIDHSTTIEESSSNSGGLYGKGGDILYRWGNPQNYGRGTVEDKILGAQHGVNWIPSGYPGEGNFLLFNNQHLYYGGPSNSNNRSAVLEIQPPIDGNGFYNIDNENPFEPELPIIVYENNFFSNFQSGAFRLSNGNTIITSTAESLIFEINQNEEVELVYDNYPSARASKYGYEYFVLIQGDINQDDIVNILDIVQLISIVLENQYVDNADLNGDDIVNVLDIVQLVNIILN